MSLEPSEETKGEQREAQRLLGRCILRLQQYERLLKALLVDHEISGPVQDHGTIRAKLETRTARKNLGTLIGEFVASYLVVGDQQDVPEPEEDGIDDLPTVSFRQGLVLTAEDHAKTASDLKELVDLRNWLVHHFVDEHDLWSAEGCRRAQDVLMEAYVRIDASYGRLVDIGKIHDAARQAVAETLQSEEFRNLVIHGIMPDGTVDWPASSLVSGFREAGQALAVAKDQWVSVAVAGRWIVEKYPDQTPERFGCKTWQQALQESKVFDLRYLESAGSRMICFKPKANPKTTNAPVRTWQSHSIGAPSQGPDK